MVLPKKSLGQHFLTDQNIARKIIDAIPPEPSTILEIGPGTGVLSKYLLEMKDHDALFVETDGESVEYLHDKYPEIKGKILQADFLKTDLQQLLPGEYKIVGNLPYNISSQIFFRMLEDRDRLCSAVVMIQKEVADRIKSGPGNKTYGILSVLLQTWFDIEYLFTVSPNVFYPPPKVNSAVIKLSRNSTQDIGCKPEFYFALVKAGFNQRRKTLRNSIKAFLGNRDTAELEGVLSKRAEQLGVHEFIELANILSK